VVLGLVGAGLSGCGINRSPYADVPQLEVAWIASLGQMSRFTEHTATEDLWIAFEAESSQLLALKLADGSVAWTLPSQEPCGFSKVNADGLLAVRSGTRPNCDQVGLIDTTTGEEVWSADAGIDQFNPVEAGEIGLSGRTVSATGVCGVDRWEARSGKKLTSIKGSQKFQDLPGNCRGALTSSDLAIVVGPKTLVGYDVDTGEKRWSREGKDPDIGSLHSTAPLLAEVQIDGVAGLRTIEPASGELGPIIGRPRGRTMSPGPVSVVGDRVVGSYQRGSRQGPDGTYEAAVRAWDPSSGKELASWPGRDHEDYLGAGNDGIDLGREVPGGRSGSSTSYWVTRADWSGNPARTVGWVDDDLTSPFVVGDLLIDTGYGDLTDDTHGPRAVAYRLPEKTTAAPIPRPKYAEKVKWAKGDVRPDPAIDPCAEVSDETLRGAGFASLIDREVPLDCEWSTGSTTLTTHVDVVSPDSRGDAIQNAQAATATARGWMESPVAIDGLGDEAWAAVSTYVASGPDETYQIGDPTMSSTEIRVAVRQKNVVAYVTLKDWPDPRGFRLPAAAAAREASVVAVLRDVVEAAGLELRVPAEASDGPVTQLPDVCDAVAADVRKALPEAKATDLTAPTDVRLRGCLWATRRAGYIDAHVQIVAYAVGASPLTGATGAVAAEEVFADSRGKLANPLRDKKWDESVMAEDYVGGYSDASHVMVRKDNLILVVGINLRDRDKPIAPTIAQRVADQAMKAIRR
jgi:hypothetical protein